MFMIRERLSPATANQGHTFASNGKGRRIDDLDDTTPRKRQRFEQNTPSDLSSPSHIPNTPIPTYTPRQLSINPYAKTASYEYSLRPPTATDLLASLDLHDIPSKIYQPPYYSDESDAPERPREYAGLVYHLKGGTGIANLQEWSSPTSTAGLPLQSGRLSSTGVCGWEYAAMPPSVKQAKEWLKSDEARAANAKTKKGSQVSN